MQSRPFPPVLVALVLAIAIVNMVAEAYHWYWLMRWFDMPMHFAGGMWVAGVVLWWRFFSGKFPIVQVQKEAIFAWAILGALGIGVLWEAYEAVVSYLTVGHMNDMWDTMSDLCFDILGGLVVASVVWIKQKHN